MTSTADELLVALKLRRDELAQRLHGLQNELLRLDKAIEALSAQNFFAEITRLAPPPPRQRTGTLKQMAYTVLHMAGRARTAAQILQDIELQFGQKIDRTSMSPQLSRLGRDQLLVRTGNLWRLNPDRPPEADKYYLLDVAPRLV